jgi:hypothetical protein
MPRITLCFLVDIFTTAFVIFFRKLRHPHHEPSSSSGTTTTESVFTVKQLLPGVDDGISVDFVRVKLAAEDVLELEFDVTQSAQHWILKPEENAGVAIECIDNCDSIVFRSEEEAVLDVETSKKSASARFNHMRRFKRSPMRRAVDTYSSSSQKKRTGNECVNQAAVTASENTSSHRHRHNAKKQRHHERKHSGESSGEPRRHKCCRDSMEVPIADMTGYGFVLHPQKFDAHVCHGRCPPGHLPANVHVLLQTLLRKEGGEDKHWVPKPCCAPARMEPLAVLHLSPKSTEKLQVSLWKDAVVAECRCA